VLSHIASTGATKPIVGAAMHWWHL